MNRARPTYLSLLSCLVLSATVPLPAEVRLNTIFSDDVVLQRELPVPIWGTAEPGEQVTVQFAGQTQSATADSTGSWKITLKPLATSAENQVLTVTGSKTATPLRVQNVLVGEVWYCGGQSNMEYGLMHAPDKDAVIAAANNPLLRMGRVDHNRQVKPVSDALVKWTESKPSTAKNYSAVPYYFGDYLQKALGVPVGIINTSYGGTRIEAWVSEDVLKNGPWPQDDYSVYALAQAAYDKKMAVAKPIMDQYAADKAAALKNNQPAPPPPKGFLSEFRGPAALWNGEVAPIAGFALRGFVWNQGENNGDFPGCEERYFQLLKSLAKLYRESWGQGDLPFFVMQTSTYHPASNDYNIPCGYVDIREAQLRFVEQDKNAVLVVAVDQGLLNGDVHYPQKRPISQRLTNSVLNYYYKKPGEYCGPIYDSAEFKGSEAILHFTHIGKGLLAKDGPLVDFALAGADKKFTPAEAKIVGDTVIVRASTVGQPTAVRYCWTSTPTLTPNLFNQDDFPASPFRTDNW